MYSEEIDHVLKNSENLKINSTISVLKKITKKKIFEISEEIKKYDGKNSGEVWLLENFSFIKQLVDENLNCKYQFRTVIFHAIYESLGKKDFIVKNDTIRNFLDEINKVISLKEKEISCLKDLFIACLVKRISVCCKVEKEDLPRYVQGLRSILKIDFSQLERQFSPVEKLLRKDPAGIYHQMTKESQAMYRRSIEKEGKRKRKSEVKICEEKLKRAEKENKHIGFFLEEKSRSVFYYILFFSTFLLLSVFVFLLLKSFLLTFLFLPIVYFLVRFFIDFFFSRVMDSKILPGIKCDTVSIENKSCVVITSLIFSKESIDDLCEKIKKQCINNRDEGDSLFFGLICDLPQSKKANEPNDQILIQYLDEKIKELNKGINCFFAIIRKRVFHETEGLYVGWERKRGALEQFVSLLKGIESGDDLLFFGTKEVIGSKFFITLDGDTEIGIGQAKRLIGKMIHPLNRPIIGRKYGKKCVIYGHGIIQPKVRTSLLTKIKTPYAKIFSNGGGLIPYASASYDTMQTIFGEGIFCGKGIIDVDAYYEILNGLFPEGRILSHDMPEGALLRSAAASEEYFNDSDPQNAVSYYKRLHRWIRGDVQNIPFWKGLSPIRVYFAAENILRYLLPVFQVGILFISNFYSRRTSAICALLILLYHFSGFINTVVSVSITGEINIFLRRFRTKIRNLVLNAFYQSIISLSGIVHEAYYFSDAIIRSIFRMKFSKKKLLEWQVFSPFSKGKDDILFFLPSIALSVLLLFFSKSVLTLFIFVLSLFFPILMSILSKQYIENDVLTFKQRNELLEFVKKEFLYFQNTIGEQTSFLPPDNVQFEPVEKIANKTSPTNIGLYLVTLCCALELRIISEETFLDKINKALSTIEKLEHHHGHLFNWYDLSTLGVIGEKFVSTVDSGNYIASLIVTLQTLKKLRNSDILKSCKTFIEKEISGANFAHLFDFKNNLFNVGIFPDEKSKETSHYDLYMSEARITSFLAIASGQVPSSHWKTLQRPLLNFSGRVGIGSWTGTSFEYFMPPLFLPVVDNSMEDESLDYSFYCQRKFCAMTKYGEVFGISESGYQRTDEAGNLQYYAFGTPYLSVQNKEYFPKVISPYSSFLMLQQGALSVLKNLEKLKNIDCLGPWGFYEAVDFHSNFMDDYNVVKSYMAHHKGMSIIALCNALKDNIIVDRFISYKNFAAKTELLAERFPIEGKIYRKKNFEKQSKKFKAPEEEKMCPLKEIPENGSILTDGKLTFLCYDNFANRFLFENMDLFDPEKGGIRVKLISEQKTIFFDKEDLKNVSVKFSGDCMEFFYTKDRISLEFKISLICGRSAFFVRAEVNGISSAGKIEIEFDVILQNFKEYQAHPAFQNLSLEGQKTKNCLLIRRREVDSFRNLYIQSPKEFSVSFQEQDFEEGFSMKMLMSPKVRLSFDLKEGKPSVLPIFFSLNGKDDETLMECLDGLYQVKPELISLISLRNFHLNSVCFEDQKVRNKENEFLLFLNKKREFFLSEKESILKNELWSYGISGDVPIFTVSVLSSNEENFSEVSEYLRAYKKLFLSGIKLFDLVILHQSEGGYFDKIRNELSALISNYKCDFLIGQHPGIHVISAQNENTFERFSRISRKFISLDDCNFYKKTVDENGFNGIVYDFGNFDGEENVGVFLNQGFEINKKKFYPKVPFSHVISGKRIGFVCDQNSLGFTWYRNAGLGRISKWENIPDQNTGEKIFLKTADGTFDLLQTAEIVTYQNGYVIYSGSIQENLYSVIATASDEISAKIVFILLSDPLKADSEIQFSFIPTLGQKPDRNILVSKKDGFSIIKPAIYTEYQDEAFFFVNANYNISSYGERICFTFKPEEESVLLLGGFSSQKHLEFIQRKVMHLDFETILETAKEKQSLLVKPNLSGMEFWSRYQASTCRFFARTGVYQSSGAFGFRDQLQDCLVFLKDQPQITKGHILRCAAHQFKEGDVLHWWHTIRRGDCFDPGVRTRCSDDYLWLLFAVSEYIRETKDEKILDLKVPFLSLEKLKDTENERYSNSVREGFGTLREHLELCVRLFIDRGLLEHNLPDIGSGDWNDGMNKISGESVWLGFFGAICFGRTKSFFEKSLQGEMDLFLEKLKLGLSKSFNGNWFVRVFCKNGLILGNDPSLESECSIDLITQAFAAFYQIEFFGSGLKLEDDNVKSALLAAYDILFSEKVGTTKLFTKPFVKSAPSPGYIQRYCAGVRENGGQYTHAAVWFALAMIRYGKLTSDKKMIQKGIKVFEGIDPSKNVDIRLFKKYQREPYVLCGDVYEAKEFSGHGGWSWYTGAAAWYVKLLEEVKKIKEELS